MRKVFTFTLSFALGHLVAGLFAAAPVGSSGVDTDVITASVSFQALVHVYKMRIKTETYRTPR